VILEASKVVDLQAEHDAAVDIGHFALDGLVRDLTRQAQSGSIDWGTLEIHGTRMAYDHTNVDGTVINAKGTLVMFGRVEAAAPTEQEK
jgi:hypothetical protein